MFVPGSDSKDFLNKNILWNEARMTCCQVIKACNKYAHNSDSSE